MVKIEPNTRASTSSSTRSSRSPSKSIHSERSNRTSPSKNLSNKSSSPKRSSLKITIKIEKSDDGERISKNDRTDRKKSQKKKKKKKKQEKDGSLSPKKEPVDPDPNAPLQVNLQTKAQKRRKLRKNIKLEETEDIQDARRREKERLERLEKLRNNAAVTAASYESVPSTSQQQDRPLNFITTDSETRDTTDYAIKTEKIDSNEEVMPSAETAFTEKDDDIICDAVVQKAQVEVVDLSSDDEDQTTNGRQFVTAYIQGVPSRKFVSPQRQEELRARKIKRPEETLDNMSLTAEGRLLVNEGKPSGDPDVFVSKHLTKILQPHQLGGIRFMYDNVIESIKDFNPNAGFGCILAHAMGLGKSLQVIAFAEIFFRITPCKKVLIISPINVIQNWYQEFDRWLPDQDDIRTFPVFLLGDTAKSQASRINLVSKWVDKGGVLLLGYEMFRLLTMKRRKRKVDKPEETINDKKKDLTPEEASEIFYSALVDPGPDLIVCDEGHRIKNLKTDVANALSSVRTKRRIVLTGYPLQNNLLEYYTMIDFIRPSYLGTKKHFQLMFDRPIKNGMCIDSTKRDIKIARQRTHVLTNMIRGFVQRRTHHLLKKILPDSLEYVLVLRKTPVQKDLYKAFVRFIQKELTSENANYYNPLKAHSVCSKIWNHPDLLYKAWERQLELLDYSHLEDVISASEKKLAEAQHQSLDTPSSMHQQYNNHSLDNGFGQHPQSGFYFNQPQPMMNNGPYCAGMLPNQATTQYVGGGQFMNANNHVSLQQNYSLVQVVLEIQLNTQNNPWLNQYMDTPPSSNHGTYSMASQISITKDTPPPSSNVATNGRATKKRKKKESDMNEMGELDKAAKRKRPAKKRLVQLITDDDEGGSIPYYWADSIMSEYVQGVLTHSNKMLVSMAIIHETIRRGEKILVFSTSLLTLSLIEDFLKMHGSIETEHGLLEWKRNSNYFRFDGSTSAIDRERMINQFNSDPEFRLFLISTRAGSLGVNLVAANRVIIFDASWNPCHDAQAVCRIYRYGQKNKTYIYRLILSNCMERAIFSRQISKHGLQQRVVDERMDVDANVTQKELENLIVYDERQDIYPDEVDSSGWNIEDDVLKSIAMAEPKMFSECPWLHETCIVESEEQLSNEEKLEAEILYEREKKGLLYPSSLSQFEPPQNNFENFGHPSIMPPFNMQPPYVNRFPLMMNPGQNIHVSPMNHVPMPYRMPVTINQPFHRLYQQPPIPSNRTPPLNMYNLSSNPVRLNTRPVNRSSQIIHNRRVIVDENLNLACVSKPGTNVFIGKGDSVLVVKTAAGGVYLRCDNGIIADASKTKYAEERLPDPNDIIELD